MGRFVAKIVGAVALSVASVALAQGPKPTPDKRPEVPKSIANVTSAHFRNGPLFERAKLAFAAANEGGDTAFSAFVTKNAPLSLKTYHYPDPVSSKNIDSNLIRALMQSCDGPLSYDEGTYWVELNWVCRVDAEAPISRYYTFRDSPEIVMLIDFDGNQIKRVEAMEPLMIPGVKRLAMNAYEYAHSKK